VQEAFVKIWKNAHRFDATKGLPSTWMAVIVRRTALDRRPKPAQALPADLEAPALDLDYVHPRLREALAELPEVHRKALVLMYVHGLSHSELAEAMQAPLGTVKSWVRRASACLKEKLER
jgi:RNA polymerase sigma-70 factor (ECF subfamily)